MLVTRHKQQGQTLIETVTAMFILVMGIVAAFGLGTYALSTTSGITNQVIGMGLAREGIEVVKNMRDTNWLNGTLSKAILGTDGNPVGGCYDYQNEAWPSGICYKDWLQKNGGSGYYNLISSSVSSAVYVLEYTSNNDFNLGSPNASSPNYLVYKQTGSDLGYVQFSGSPSSTAQATNFYRRITIQKKSDGAFSKGTGDDMRALIVTVDVWWSQKGCPTASTPDALPNTCKITLETFLTNWKTY